MYRQQPSAFSVLTETYPHRKLQTLQTRRLYNYVARKLVRTLRFLTAEASLSVRRTLPSELLRCLPMVNCGLTSAGMLLDGRAVWMRMQYLHAQTMLEDCRLLAGGFRQHECVKVNAILISKP